MAFCAFHVPILVTPGPMQLIGMIHLFLRIKMKPTLPPFGLRSTVPGNTERLIAASGKFDQILLQGFHTKRISNRVIRQFTVRAIGTHHKFAVSLKESRFDIVMFEFSVVEIAEHGLCISFLHRQVMIRAVPCLEFGLMTFLARACTNEFFNRNLQYRFWFCYLGGRQSHSHGRCASQVNGSYDQPHQHKNRQQQSKAWFTLACFRCVNFFHVLGDWFSRFSRFAAGHS